MGIDKTYKLGEVHVTVTCFKHPKLQRINRKEHPIMIGPMMLHGTDTHDVYAQLLTKFVTSFKDEELRKLVIGCDEEAALRRAIREVLPNSVNVLCYRHVRGNILRHLRDDVGLDESNRDRLVNYIFGPHGLLTASDDEEFSDRVLLIKQFASNTIGNTSFDKYLDHVSEAIRIGIFRPMRSGIICDKWTNNNCESVNHLLKAALKWKTRKLPDLIEELQVVISTQAKDIERAIYGAGDYCLISACRHYQVSATEWAQLTQAVKEKKKLDFLRDRRRKRHAVESSDGKLQVLTSPSRGRKPGQIKRSRSERTTTITQ